MRLGSEGLKVRAGWAPREKPLDHGCGCFSEAKRQLRLQRRAGEGAARGWGAGALRWQLGPVQRNPGGGKATRCQAGDGRVSSGKGVRARPLPPAPLRVSRPLSPHPHPTASLGRGLPPRPPRFPFFCGDHSILSRPGEGCHVCRGPVTSCHSQTLRGLTSPGWPGPSRLSPDAHTPAPRPHSRSRWHACMPSHADSHTPRALTRPPSHTPAGSERGALARPGREQPEDKRPSQDRPAGKGPRASPEG